MQCEPVETTTECAYKFCNKFVHVSPRQLPDIAVAKEWTNRPAFMPAKYAKFAEAIHNFEVRPDDIWIVTFAKCGTTWTQEMVRLLHSDLDYEAASKQCIEDQFGFLEAFCIFDPTDRIDEDSEFAFSSVERANNLPSPRFMKCHLPIEILPKAIWTVRPKVIYTARNPKDTAVSFFHHYRNMHGYLPDMVAFMRAFLAEEIIFGPFHDHVLNFWKTRNEPNVLFLTYEQMQADLMSVMRRTQEFLGKSFSEEQLGELGRHLHVDTMRQNVNANNTTLLRNCREVLGGDFQDKDFM